MALLHPRRADEVTIPRIMLRYGWSGAVLSGDLALVDLPGAWNDGMRAWVSCRPTTRGLSAGHPLADGGGAIPDIPRALAADFTAAHRVPD